MPSAKLAKSHSHSIFEVLCPVFALRILSASLSGCDLRHLGVVAGRVEKFR